MNREHPTIRRAGLGAALLGTSAGVAQILVGTAPWLGDKNEPTTLGFVTILLAVTVGQQGGPGYQPAPLLLLAASPPFAMASRRDPCPAHFANSGPAFLLGFLALAYLVLGISMRGPVGILAVWGSLAIAAALLLLHRSRAVAAVVLLAG